MNSLRLTLLVLLAMSAFAGNSVLCRLALKGSATDPASFSVVRVLAGAVVLTLLLSLRGGTRGQRASGWSGAIALSAYAVAFSFAYVQLTTGTGALLLFGAVQGSLIGYGLRSGERLSPLALIGLAIGIVGLFALLLPGSDAPHLGSALLMISAGAAWAWYTVLGRRNGDPLLATTSSFLRAVPIVIICAAPFYSSLRMDIQGLTCALVSGAVASGMGYTIWYHAVPHLSAVRASAVQLSVPVLSAAVGIVALGEPLSARLVLASIAVLGGVGLVLAARERRR